MLFRQFYEEFLALDKRPASDDGKLTESPVKRARLYRQQNGRPRYLTEDEEARLLAVCRRQ